MLELTRGTRIAATTIGAAGHGPRAALIARRVAQPACECITLTRAARAAGPGLACIARHAPGAAHVHLGTVATRRTRRIAEPARVFAALARGAIRTAGTGFARGARIAAGLARVHLGPIATLLARRCSGGRVLAGQTCFA